MNKLRKSYSPGWGWGGGGGGLVLVKFKEWSKPFNYIVCMIKKNKGSLSGSLAV